MPDLTSLVDLPRALVTELGEAGLDVEETYAVAARALEEDLRDGPYGGQDLTSVATLPQEQVGIADLAARESGVLAGGVVAELVFRMVLGDEVEISGRLPDGTRVGPGDVAMTVAGPLRGLLTAERTALNLACHLSGVATATSRWVAALEGTRARVLDTRKTLPGLRSLQKYAVRCGGGVNHRFGLSDMAMAKDNHVLAAGGVVPALEAIRERFPQAPVEVEVTDLDQLRELLAAGCERVLLDNMDDATMAEAVRLRDASGVDCSLEASGGLTLERAASVAATGVDFISVGALTHSVIVFDLGMDLRA